MKETTDNMTRIYRIRKKVTVGEADQYYPEYQPIITAFGFMMPIFFWRPIFRLPYQNEGYSYGSCKRAQKAIESDKEEIIKYRNRRNAKSEIVNDNECNEGV